MKQPDIHSISHIKLPHANHIGILVKDIPDAVVYYTKLFNIKNWYRSKIEKIEAIYRGKPINAEADIVLAFQGGVEFELIQVKSKEENVYSEMIAKSGGGIHHLGFHVSDYDRKMEEMKANGIEVIQYGVVHTKGAAITRFAHLDTIKQCGTISEFLSTTLIGFPLPHGKFIMDMGCLTGQVERVKV